MGRRLGVAVSVAFLVALASPVMPAAAHDITVPIGQEPKASSKVGATLPGARVLAASLPDPTPGKPARVEFDTTVTRNPDNAAFLEPYFTTPADACAPPLCAETTFDVAPGSTRTLYARVEWPNPISYVHLWGIAPDGSIVGQSSTSGSFDKTAGNERTIPVAEFTVAEPQAGTWRLQTRAVFGYEIPIHGSVALVDGPAIEYPRLDPRTLADRHLTQHLTFNIVFAGRTWSPEEVAAFEDGLPDEFRLSVHSKERPDCPGWDDNGIVAVRSWSVCHFSGTADEGAAGAKPYFEPVKFTFDHRFLQADERWTRDLFATMEAETTKAEPFTNGGQSDYLAFYDSTQGSDTRGDRPVADPTVGDKIDAIAVEQWIFRHRLDEAYARSFRDLQTGATVSGSFITPDPGAYYDPYYSAKGTKDIETMPQGPATSLTFFVLDTFTDRALVDEHFRPDAYHFYDVSDAMVDPDTDAEYGPDFMRVWGGRYRFFFHDLGAGPNNYELPTSLTGDVQGSASYPDGDPPIWDYDNDPKWRGLLPERTARDAATMLLYRLVAPFNNRPLPADVFLLAGHNWHDCYANPTCSPDGVSLTDLTKLYDPEYVDLNLGSAIPAVTFRTERSEPSLRTYRYLGCARQRAVANPNVITSESDPVVLVPDANCVGKQHDPIQEALEEAKARGDDLVGPGVNDFGVSAHVMRRYVEEHRDELAPQPPGQFTMTSLNAIFPGGANWFLPIPFSAVGALVFTPNGESWGIVQSLNEVVKPSTATDCSKSSPLAPGCGTTPAMSAPRGFSYIVQHEASHFLGLHHPHDSIVVEKDDAGRWQRYGYSYRHYGDFSQAPTSYAGAFTPYSVIDQDILQRGHAAEYLRRMQDSLSDAYFLDGAAGLAAPSAATVAKVRAAEQWRDQASALFACGDYLHAERAMRNASLAAQGVDGPAVTPRQLRPNERVVFEVKPQAVYAPDGGAMSGCVAGSSVGAGSGSGAGAGAGAGSLPASGPSPSGMLCLFALAAGISLARVRRRAPR